jgi:hypothetical protein
MICLTLDLPFICDHVELCYNYRVVEMWFSKQAKTFICSPFDKNINRKGKIKIMKSFTNVFYTIIFIFKNCHKSMIKTTKFCAFMLILLVTYILLEKKRKRKTRSGLTSIDLEPNGCTQDKKSTL